MLISLAQILIFGFVLPSFLVITGRFLFAFHLPMNAGIDFADFTNHSPLPPSKLALRLFNSTNGALFLLSYLSFSLIFILPLIDRFYPFGLSFEHIVLITYIFTPLYATWLLTLFTTGYIFGRCFYQEFFSSKMETKFYGKALYDNYASVIEQPALLMQNIKLIFENEKKIQQRIDRHTSIMLDYKKQKDKVKAKEMNDSIKFNIGELKTVEALRKKHGRLSVYFRNIKKFGGNVIFGLFLSVLSWYLIIAETFIGLFPPLSKIYEQNEPKPTKS